MKTTPKNWTIKKAESGYVAGKTIWNVCDGDFVVETFDLKREAKAWLATAPYTLLDAPAPKARSYSGKYPHRIRSVAGGNVLAVRTYSVESNGGERLTLDARLLMSMPRLGDDIRELRFAVYAV